MAFIPEANFSFYECISEYSTLKTGNHYRLYKGPERSYCSLATVPVVSVTNCMEQCTQNKECDGLKVTVTGKHQCVLLASLFSCESESSSTTHVYEKVPMY